MTDIKTNININTSPAKVQKTPVKVQETSVNNNAVDNKVTKNGDTITIAGKEINKKTAIIGGIAILGTIAGIALFIIKGKNKPKIQPEDSIRKFFDKNNNPVENVEFKKGKAIKADGGSFSGFFKTTNKNGDKVTIEYNKGIIKKSSVEGKFEKVYKSTNGEITEVAIKKGNKTKKVNLKKIKDAVNCAQNDYKDFMDKSISFSPADLKKLEKYDGKYLTKAQQDDMAKLIKKLNRLKEQYNKDIKEITTFAYSKEMEFREKIPGFQKTYQDAIKRFNNNEGTIEKDGTKIIKDYSGNKLSKEITLKDGGRLTIRDFNNKTLLEGRYNETDSFFEVRRYYEGYEKTDKILKYNKMYKTGSMNIYDDGYLRGSKGAFTQILGKYQEGYSKTGGHEKIAKEFSFNNKADGSCMITLENMKKLAEGKKIDAQFTVPAFSEGGEILSDGTQKFKKKIGVLGSHGTFDYFTNLNCSAENANIDFALGVYDKFFTIKLNTTSQGNPEFKELHLNSLAKKYKTIKDWIK